MNKVLLIFFLFICYDINAQLLNKIFQTTDDSTKAKYYRLYFNQDSSYLEKIYYLNGPLYSVTSLSSKEPMIRNGKRIVYSPNGEITEECVYVNDRIDGKYSRYYKNGNLEIDIDYSNGKINGYLKSFYNNGNTRRIDKYKSDQFIEGKCFGTNGQDTSYFVYEQNASFQKGDVKKFQKYISERVKYPKEARRQNITGKVIISFIVNPEGKIVDTEVLQSPSPYLSKAALDVILASPDWEPGIQEGKKVEQRFVIPIIFKIQ